MVRRRRPEVIEQLPPRTDTVVPVPLTDAQLDEHDAFNQPTHARGRMPRASKGLIPVAFRFEPLSIGMLFDGDAISETLEPDSGNVRFEIDVGEEHGTLGPGCEPTLGEWFSKWNFEPGFRIRRDIMKGAARTRMSLVLPLDSGPGPKPPPPPEEEQHPEGHHEHQQQRSRVSPGPAQLGHVPP